MVAHSWGEVNARLSHTAIAIKRLCKAIKESAISHSSLDFTTNFYLLTVTFSVKMCFQTFNSILTCFNVQFCWQSEFALWTIFVVLYSCLCIQASSFPEVWDLSYPGVWWRWERGLGSFWTGQTQPAQTGQHNQKKGSYILIKDYENNHCFSIACTDVKIDHYRSFFLKEMRWINQKLLRIHLY